MSLTCRQPVLASDVVALLGRATDGLDLDALNVSVTAPDSPTMFA